MNTRWNLNSWLSFLDSHIVDYPTPITLNYNWSFGSTAGISLAIQILSGIFLAIHYTPHIDYAFSSVDALSLFQYIGPIFKVKLFFFKQKKRFFAKWSHFLRVKKIKVYYDFLIFKSNKDFFYYVLAFIPVLLGTVLWGLFYTGYDLGFYGGLALSGLCFKKVIVMPYPKSLEQHKILIESWSEVLKKIQSFIVIALASLCFFSLFFYFLFPLLDLFGLLLIDHTQEFLLGLSLVFVLFCLLILGVLPLVLDTFIDKTKKSIKTLVFTRANKKIYLFFHKYYRTKNPLFVYLLGALSFFVHTPILFYPFILTSVRNDHGLTAFWLYVVSIIFAFLVTLPSFRCSFFQLYSRNSLRIIGWNGPEITAGRLITTVVGVGAAWATKNVVDEGLRGMVTRENQIRYDALERKRWKEFNEDMRIIKQMDPDGNAKGQYKIITREYKPIVQHTPPCWPENLDLFKLGKTPNPDLPEPKKK